MFSKQWNQMIYSEKLRKQNASNNPCLQFECFYSLETLEMNWRAKIFFYFEIHQNYGREYLVASKHNENTISSLALCE